jgi:hypothetical protein
VVVTVYDLNGVLSHHDRAFIYLRLMLAFRAVAAEAFRAQGCS